LKVDRDGHVSHHENFSQSFGSLAKELTWYSTSRVLDARLFAVTDWNRVEVMILDLGDIALHGSWRYHSPSHDSVGFSEEEFILVDADGASKFELSLQGVSDLVSVPPAYFAECPTQP
jgi:hypothetical protein